MTSALGSVQTDDPALKRHCPGHSPVVRSANRVPVGTHAYLTPCSAGDLCFLAADSMVVDR